MGFQKQKYAQFLFAVFVLIAGTFETNKPNQKFEKIYLFIISPFMEKIKNAYMSIDIGCSNSHGCIWEGYIPLFNNLKRLEPHNNIMIANNIINALFSDKTNGLGCQRIKSSIDTFSQSNKKRKISSSKSSKTKSKNSK